MGYRSNVTAVIYGAQRNADKYEALRVLMNTTFEEVYDAWSGCAEWNTRNKVLIFTIEDVKWYDSFSDIRAFKAMLETLADDLKYNYELVRFGEDDDDIDADRDGSDVEHILSVCRTVDINF